MTPTEFAALAEQNYNRIPVIREVLADLETPLSCYLKLARGAYSYLFESVQGGEKWGRYSLIGMPATTILKVYGDQLTIERDGEQLVSRNTDDPLREIEEFQSSYRMPELPQLPRFTGGLVGYFGYDTVRYIEPRLKKSVPPDALGTPDILLMVSDEVVIFDNLLGKLILGVHEDASEPNAWNLAQTRLDELEAKLANPLPDLPPLKMQGSGLQESAFVSSFGEQNFKQAVNKIKDYVLAGDVMQVVPSQRLSMDFEAEPLNLYRALRCLNPSPYLYFLELDGVSLVGASPEVLVRVEDSTVTVRPIAGTRPRGRTPDEERALADDLLHDEKELAEHRMLLDLGRNDVGRVAEYGSVAVPELMVVERYSHVMHLVSQVEGKLREGLGAIDVFRACFPAGTLSGAPKVRAMEIIDELEPVRRGPYGGAVGHFNYGGMSMDTAITIRTLVATGGKAYVQAGAGIVADSDPSREYEETLNKAQALLQAVAMVSGG